MLSNEEKINVILIRIKEMVFKIDYLINHMNSGSVEESIFYTGEIPDIGSNIENSKMALLALEKELETLTNQG